MEGHLAVWWTLGKSNIISVLEPKGLKSLFCSMEISFLSLKFLRISVTLFSIWIRRFKILSWSINFFQTLSCHLQCFSFYKQSFLFKMTTVLPLCAFCAFYLLSLLSWKNLASKLSFNQSKPVIYRRCIDNTFLHFCLKHCIKKFQNYLNHQHKNIRFISETENKNSISFLDIEISRDNNKFTASVYGKPTFSGVFTNFSEVFTNSFIWKSSKYNLIVVYLITQGIQTLLKFWTFSSGNWQA